jgi:hypothetical protein
MHTLLHSITSSQSSRSVSTVEVESYTDSTAFFSLTLVKVSRSITLHLVVRVAHHLELVC